MHVHVHAVVRSGSFKDYSQGRSTSTIGLKRTQLSRPMWRYSCRALRREITPEGRGWRRGYFFTPWEASVVKMIFMQVNLPITYVPKERLHKLGVHTSFETTLRRRYCTVLVTIRN